MLVLLDKPVIEKIWTGDFLIIKSYDTENGIFYVEEECTGKKFTHSSSLDCTKLSFLDKSEKDDVIKYLISRGVNKFHRLPMEYEELIHPTNQKMGELIVTLDKINNSNIPIHNNNYYDENNQLIEKASNLACDCLITSEGGNNWNNINILNTLGYKVYPKERDSFGWLIGAIRKPGKGIILYG